MKLELKKVTYNARLSQETSAFAAEIWIDGAKRGSVMNDGGGAPNRYEDRAAEKEIDAYAKTLPKVKSPFSDDEYERDTDMIVGDLLDEHLEGKRLARMMKTKTVFVRGGKIYSVKAGGHRAQSGDVVLNTMPLDEAVKAFIAGTSQ